MGDEKILDRIFLITERMIIFDGLEDVFDHITKTAVTLTRADAATIRVFNIETGNLEIVNAYGVSNTFLNQNPIQVGEGVIGQVVLNGEAYSSADISNEAAYHNPELAELEGIGATLSVPMKSNEGSIGCITVYRKSKQNFADQDLLLLSIFSAEAVQAVEKAKLIKELKRQASYDMLTGLYNKRVFLQKLEQEVERSQRHGNGLSIMFLDLDNFKTFNDSHGHLMGDKLIHDFTSILKTHCRKIDILGRFGGDEFVIIAPQTDGHGAKALAEKLRKAVSDANFAASKKGNHFKTTCSIGIAELNEENNSSEALLDAADKALYQSKRKGRNCVTLFSNKLALQD